MKKLILALILPFSFINQAFAITATAEAVVVGAITVAQTTALNFGSFSSSTAGGTITQAGVATGDVTAVGSAAAPAVFAVSGSGTSAYTFNLPATATIGIGGSGGTNQMTTTLAFATGSSSRTLSAGADNVTVNGTLTVPASQLTGSYAGTYLVTVNY
jgi:hypothetical protein